MADSTYPIALASSAEKCALAMANLTQKIHQTTAAFQQQATTLKAMPLSKKTAGEGQLPTTSSQASSLLAEVNRFTDLSTQLAKGLNKAVAVVEGVKQGVGAFKEVKEGIGDLLDSFTFAKEKSSGSVKGMNNQHLDGPKQGAGSKKPSQQQASKQDASSEPPAADGTSRVEKVEKLVGAIQTSMDLIQSGADFISSLTGQENGAQGSKESAEGEAKDKPAQPFGDSLRTIFDNALKAITPDFSGVTSFADVNAKITSGLTGALTVFQGVEEGIGAFKEVKDSFGDVVAAFKPSKEQDSTEKTPQAKSAGQTNTKAKSGINQSIKKATISINRLNRTIRSSNMGSAGGRRRKGGKKSAKKGKSYRRNTTNRLPNVGDQALAKHSTKTVNTSLPAAGKATGLTRIKGLMKTLGSGAGKLFRPLNAVLQAPELASAIATGDSKQIGATAGNVAGGMGGAAAGALAGAAIGSVVPLLGTAVGGLIGSVVGGLGGSSIGEWAGSKMGSWFSENKTEQPAPDPVSSQTQSLQEGNKSIHFAPVINLTPTGNPAYDQDVSNQMIARLKTEFAQGVLLNMDVATRRDASLSDNRLS